MLIAVVPSIKYVSGGFPDSYADKLKAAKAFAEYLRDTEWYTSERSCRMRAIVVYDVKAQAVRKFYDFLTSQDIEPLHCLLYKISKCFPTNAVYRM